MARTMRSNATMNSNQRANRTRQQVARRAATHAIYHSYFYPADGLAEMLQNTALTSNQEYRHETTNASSSSNCQRNHPLDFGLITSTQQPGASSKNSTPDPSSSSSSISRKIHKPARSNYKIEKRSIHPNFNSLYHAAEAERISGKQQPDKSIYQLISILNNIFLSSTQDQTESKTNVTLSSDARCLIEEYRTNIVDCRSEAIKIEFEHRENKAIKQDHDDIEMVNTINCGSIKCFRDNSSSLFRFAKPVEGASKSEEFLKVYKDEKIHLMEDMEGMESMEGPEVEEGGVKMEDGFDMSTLSEALPSQ